MILPLDQRPVIVALAGSNGAGKTTFYHAHLKPAGLRFINADNLSRELALPSYQAADVAAELRQRLLEQRESFVFETVFSDPVGDKIAFLEQAVQAGFNVIVCFIGIASPKTSEQRVAMRVSQGGHDVPADKLKSRYPRTLDNLRLAIQRLPRVWIFDNDDLQTPFRLVAVFERNRSTFRSKPFPRWLHKIVRK